MKMDQCENREQNKILMQRENEEFLKTENMKKETEIYDYMKEHPSIFVSLISGFVVVIGFLFNCIIYANECKYLEYWHLNKRLVKINSEHQIYELVGMSFFFLTIMFIQLLIIATVDRYCKNQAVFLEAKILSKKIAQKLKKLKKRIQKKKKQFKEKNNLLRPEIREIENELKKTEEYREQYDKGIENLKQKSKERKMPYDIGAIIFTFFCLLVTVYIYTVMTSTELKFLSVLIVTIIVFLSLWLLPFLVWRMMYALKTHVKFAKGDMHEHVEYHLKSCKRLLNMEKHPIKKMLEFNLKDYLTKNIFNNMVINFLIILLIFIGMISSINVDQIEGNRLFDIVEYKKVDYAIIYRDDQYLYLEEIRIQENDIYIYVNNQMRVSEEELYSVNREFDKVIQIFDEEIE